MSKVIDQVKKMMETATYSVRYVCNNCGKAFKRDIEKGVRASERAICPNCGLSDGQKCY